MKHGRTSHRFELPAPTGQITVGCYCYFADLTKSPEDSVQDMLDKLGTPIFRGRLPTSGAYLFIWEDRTGKQNTEVRTNISFGVGSMMFTVNATSKNIANRQIDKVMKDVGLTYIEEDQPAVDVLRSVQFQRIFADIGLKMKGPVEPNA